MQMKLTDYAFSPASQTLTPFSHSDRRVSDKVIRREASGLSIAYTTLRRGSYQLTISNALLFLIFQENREKFENEIHG